MNWIEGSGGNSHNEAAMEKVVYILGAGFSAPLGIPVTKNFFSKSKDLYFSDQTKYKHFETVFEVVREMSVTKNYFESDLFNIEEVLSVLEMARIIEGVQKRQTFVKYICDVIKYYSPKLEYSPMLPSNWDVAFFKGYPHSTLYGFFVAALQGIEIQRRENDRGPAQFELRRIQSARTRYSVVTLNYDLVIEGVADYLNEACEYSEAVTFARTPTGIDTGNEVALAKLHGSVDKESLVPPTWNKGLSDSHILNEWKLAFKTIQQANHIRMIGYSLPAADTYVKYLLKSAVTKAENLKTIDVLCLDDEARSVKSRFDGFIHFRDYRFRSANVVNYLKLHREKHQSVDRMNKVLRFDQLEYAHEEFFS